MQQEELNILIIYVPNIGAPRFIKQVLRDLQRSSDSHTITVREFNTLLSVLDQQNRKLTRISGLEVRSGLSRPNRHQQSSAPKINRMYILWIWGGEFCKCLSGLLAPGLSSSPGYPC